MLEEHLTIKKDNKINNNYINFLNKINIQTYLKRSTVLRIKNRGSINHTELHTYA